MHIRYWWENQKDRNHCEDQEARGWTILKWNLEKLDTMDWTDVTQDRDK
jgi:hypothetical protein